MAAVIQENSGQVLISHDPATGEELGRLAVARDAHAIIAVGRHEFQKWRRTTFDERRRIILKARQVILSELDAIADLISRETGKPAAEAMAMEIAPVLDLMRHFADNIEQMLRPQRIGIGLYGLLGRSSKIVYEPLGTVLIIPAWNYPFSIPLGEAAMALLAGNTVVIKPSELTSLIGIKIGEIFEKAGVPSGVVQIATGGGSVGAALVEARPDKIMFTGSVATGKKIAAAAAKDLIPCVLELGGKDAMIVRADADLELAAGAAVWAAFCNAGQSCSSVERLYVHRDAAERLIEKIVEKTRQLKVGNGRETDISIGPMSSERQIKIVERHIDEFKKAGANIIAGGKRVSPNTLFFEPTVIVGAANDMLPMQEETFGPTLPIAVFETDEEAIKLANDSEFGLTASVWTKDKRAAARIAGELEAGTVCINEVLYTHGIGQTPWGGFKNSGLGRTHGREGLLELVQGKHIHTNRLAILPNAWWMPYSPTAAKTFKMFATRFATGSLMRTATMLPTLAKRIKELMAR